MMHARRSAIVAVVVLLVLLAVCVRAASQKLTLKGRLTGTEDAAQTGIFVLDADELGAITVNVGEVSYLGDYLAGASGHRVIVTIEPER